MASRKHSTYNSVCFVRRKNAAKNEKNILFLVLGDDRSWAEDLFRLDHDVFISPEPKRAAVDLALMAKYCDDIILTASASTFGFWGAYLAKKATVYYNAESYDFRTKHDADVFLPHWIPLNLSGNTLDENTKKTAGHYYTKLVEVV
uniref:L-Fucosyltransferase n=1 Tax=Plectus sambesii TaxID=2011161 RepID=A0A914WA27_9BILA